MWLSSGDGACGFLWLGDVSWSGVDSLCVLVAAVSAYVFDFIMRFLSSLSSFVI